MNVTTSYDQAAADLAQLAAVYQEYISSNLAFKFASEALSKLYSVELEKAKNDISRHLERMIQ